MGLDFNDADKQKDFDLIPQGAKVRLFLKLKPGNWGPDPALTCSEDGQSQWLDCEFIVVNGLFAEKRFWQRLYVESPKRDKQGRSAAGEITRRILRAILESARGIMPDDESGQATFARRLQSYFDFNSMEFAAEVDIEPGGPNPAGGVYPDKNRLKKVITPDKEDYQAIMAGRAPAPPASQAPPQKQQPQRPPQQYQQGGAESQWQRPQGPQQQQMSYQSPPQNQGQGQGQQGPSPQQTGGYSPGGGQQQYGAPNNSGQNAGDAPPPQSGNYPAYGNQQPQQQYQQQQPAQGGQAPAQNNNEQTGQPQNTQSPRPNWL